MEKTVTIQRINSQRNNSEKITKYVAFITDSIIGKFNKTWNCTPTILHMSAPCDAGYATIVELKFAYSGNNPNIAKIWGNMFPELQTLCTLPRWNNYPWKILEKETDRVAIHEVIEDVGGPRMEPINIDDIDFSDENIKEHTGHIFDRDDQIFIAASAMRSAFSTEMRVRHHCVLYGDPGCGKSAIVEGLASTIGEEEAAFIKFDATSMTSAGAIKKLMDDNSPPVLIIEEIEKTSVENLRWLLGVLDNRGELRKTNFRGHNRKSCKMFCIATVNDMKLFKSVMYGALASRFAHEIFCPRPDRKVMEQILKREVAGIEGDVKWVEPTLQLCYDQWKINDPRKVIPVCLSGRDNLLDGSFQKRLQRLRALQSAQEAA